MTLEIWAIIYAAMWVVASCEMWRHKPPTLADGGPVPLGMPVVMSIAGGAVWPAMAVYILFRVAHRWCGPSDDN